MRTRSDLVQHRLERTRSSPSLRFTAGLLVATVCPVLVAHAALRNAALRLHRLERVLLVLAYGSTLVLSGLVPAMLFDPPRQGCTECPGNLLAYW